MQEMQGAWSNRNLRRLMGKPVGVSFANGQGRSGILCGINNGDLHLLEYLHHNQFAMNYYPLNSIQGINPFPPCQRQPNQPRPPRSPRQRQY